MVAGVNSSPLVLSFSFGPSSAICSLPRQEGVKVGTGLALTLLSWVGEEGTADRVGMCGECSSGWGRRKAASLRWIMHSPRATGLLVSGSLADWTCICSGRYGQWPAPVTAWWQLQPQGLPQWTLVPHLWHSHRPLQWANWLAFLLWDHKLQLWLVPLLPLMPSLGGLPAWPCGHRLQFRLTLCPWYEDRTYSLWAHKGFDDNDLLSIQAFPDPLSCFIVASSSVSSSPLPGVCNSWSLSLDPTGTCLSWNANKCFRLGSAGWHSLLWWILLSKHLSLRSPLRFQSCPYLHPWGVFLSVWNFFSFRAPAWGIGPQFLCLSFSSVFCPTLFCGD